MAYFRKLKAFVNLKIIVIINACTAVMACGSLFAATLQIGNPSVVLMAGQSIEIPLLSNQPISGDLTARGAFRPGDVTFIPSPACRLSAHGCTLVVKVASTSKRYTAVPVVVHESGATNTPIFVLTVIHPGEPKPVRTTLPKIDPNPITLYNHIGSNKSIMVSNTSGHTLNQLMARDLPSGVNSSICPLVEPGSTCTMTFEVNDEVESGYYVISLKSKQGLLLNRIVKIVARKSSTSLPSYVEKHIQAPLQISGNTLFYGVVEQHPAFTKENKKTQDLASANAFTPSTNGAAYQIVKLTNNGVTQPLSVAITGSGAASFSLDKKASDYGVNLNCAAMKNIGTRESCLVIVKGKIGDPNKAPETAMLTIRGADNNVAIFTLTNTTYVYAAGGFNALGNARVSGGSLLAQCTSGTCSNALQGGTGNNYASTNFSVGQWINALAVTSTGNLIVGGVFGAIGGATSGATSGTAALLAQCTPGSVTGNACINQIGTSISNPYAFNNAYIDAITPPQSTNFIYLGGDFTNIRNFSVTPGGRMLAKCGYSGTSPNQMCNSYLGTGGVSTRYANNAISALDYFNANVSVGGLFTQINNYPSTPPVSGTTFASCTTSDCSQGMGSNNPNGSILGMTDDGITLYMGGTFTSIGGYVDSSGGYPLVSCTPTGITTCINALGGTNDANGYIGGLSYSGGNLYVGGNFTTIGGATPVIGGNMLAVCTPLGTCSNFVTDNNPYATGTDWGGGIFAIAVGNQTTITAN